LALVAVFDLSTPQGDRCRIANCDKISVTQFYKDHIDPDSRHRLKRFTDFLSGLLDGTPPNHLHFAGGTSGHPGAHSLIEVKEKPQSPDDLGKDKKIHYSCLVRAYATTLARFFLFSHHFTIKFSYGDFVYKSRIVPSVTHPIVVAAEISSISKIHSRHSSSTLFCRTMHPRRLVTPGARLRENKNGRE
jgi:hypothetical protein